MRICHATLRASHIPIVCADTLSEELISQMPLPDPVSALPMSALHPIRARPCRCQPAQLLSPPNYGHPGWVVVQNATSTVCSQDGWSGRLSSCFPPTPNGSSEEVPVYLAFVFVLPLIALLIATTSTTCNLVNRHSVVWYGTLFSCGAAACVTSAASATAQLLRTTPILSADRKSVV